MVVIVVKKITAKVAHRLWLSRQLLVAERLGVAMDAQLQETDVKMVAVELRQRHFNCEGLTWSEQVNR